MVFHVQRKSNLQLLILAGVTGVPGSEHHVPRIPHSLLCPVLRQFGGLKMRIGYRCTHTLS